MLLHILWLILKFILIVLGVILGLVLLAVLAVLFCPVRYRAAADKDGTSDLKEINARFRVSWLFHLLIFDVAFENRAFQYRIRILGIPLDFIRKLLRGRGGKRESKFGQGLEKAKAREDVELKPTETPKAALHMEEPHPQEESHPQEELHLQEGPRQKEVLQQQEEPHGQEDSHLQEESGQQEESRNSNIGEWKRSKWETIKNILILPIRLWKKLTAAIKGFFGKIKKIALTIRNLYDKINWWKEFLEHPKVREAISLVWGDAKKLIHHVMPTKTEGSVTFGCEDPAVTGSILAFLGMSIPLHKNCIQVTPLFHGGNYLEGHVKMKGRIYGWILVKTALEIYLNKNVKYVISRWKHKEA